MKSQNFPISEKRRDKQQGVTLEEKQFPGKALDATVFKEKFEAGNKVGRTIKGFKISKTNPAR